MPLVAHATKGILIGFFQNIQDDISQDILYLNMSNASSEPYPLRYELLVAVLLGYWQTYRSFWHHGHCDGMTFI
jgi:hypothetical protein